MRALIWALALALWAAPVQAQDTQAPAADPAAEVVQAPVKTAVRLELVDRLDSRSSQRGESFALRLAEPIEFNGATIPAGTPARGEVVDAWARTGSRPGMLVLSVRALQWNGQELPLMSETLMISPRTPETTQQGRMFDLGPRPVMNGPNVSLEPGRVINAWIGEDTSQEAGRIVFFRPRRNEAGAYRYGAREGDTQVSLSNGTYHILEVPPGIHEYEIVGTFLFGMGSSQTLRLQINPGETLYVEQAIGSLVVSNRQSFESLGLRQQTSADEE